MWMKFLFAYIAVVLASGCGWFVETIPNGTIVDGNAHDRFVRIDDLNYHYVRYPADGPKVVLIHGYGSSTYTWESVAPIIQQAGYDVWAVDMIGFGWSDKPIGADYSVPALATGVSAWMRDKGLEHAHVVGHSLGGTIALFLAIENAPLIDKLVLVDAGAYPMSSPLVIAIADAPFADSFARMVFGPWMVRWNMAETYERDDLLQESTIVAYYNRLRSRGGLEAQISLSRSIDFDRYVDIMARIPLIQKQTLIVWGREDAWIPLQVGQRLHQEIKNSQLQVLERCGHMAQEEYPQQTAQLIIEFLKGQSQATAK